MIEQLKEEYSADEIRDYLEDIDNLIEIGVIHEESITE